MNKHIISVSFCLVSLLSSCSSGEVAYEGTSLKAGQITSGEKEAVVSLYGNGISSEESLEKGDSSSDVKSKANPLRLRSKEEYDASSIALDFDSYKAEYRFSLDVTYSYGGFSFERTDKADCLLKAQKTESGFIAHFERSHSGSATLPFNSWDDSEMTVVNYQNGYAYFSNSVSNGHFSRSGKFAYHIISYGMIYQTLSDYFYRLSEDLKFAEDDSENKAALSELIDDGKADIENIDGSTVTFNFDYEKKGNYIISFDVQTGLIHSFSLELDAGYAAKESTSNTSFRSGKAKASISGEFSYGGQSVTPLSDQEISSYSLASSN
jgi:hypothetical protein